MIDLDPETHHHATGTSESAEHPGEELHEIGPMRRRILRGTHLLPSLLTVMNGVLGFGAIHFATKDALGTTMMANLSMASWLIVGAMICDMLDGRVARMTRRTSDFGGQLDSLCDAVSFGVAPAILACRAGVLVLYSQQLVPMTGAGPLGVVIGRLMWCISAIYVACAVLRLARFNVENEPDESSHLAFEGLPSPGAAGAVIGAVLLLTHLANRGWGVQTWLEPTATIAVPLITLLAALLMVSRVGYPHVVNQLIRSQRPFGTLVKLTILAVLLLIEPLIFAAAGAIGFMLAGVVREGILALRGRPSTNEEA